MHRFIITQNIERFQRCLAQETDPGKRRVVEALMSEAKRQLAQIDMGETSEAKMRKLDQWRWGV